MAAEKSTCFPYKSQNRFYDPHIDPHDKPAEHKEIHKHSKNNPAKRKSAHHAVVLPVNHHKNNAGTDKPVNKILHANPDRSMRDDSPENTEDIVQKKQACPGQYRRAENGRLDRSSH